MISSLVFLSQSNKYSSFEVSSSNFSFANLIRTALELVSGSFSNTTSYNLIGEMPFMKFYAHDKSTLPISPLVNKMKVNILDV